MSRLKIYAIFLGIAVALVACGPNWYDIELRPQGPVMERTISQSFGPEEFDRVALLYGQQLDDETIAGFDKNHLQRKDLTGRFGTRMPNDSNNSGVYVYCDSPLGSAATYTERFGGRHDVATLLRDQESAFHAWFDVMLLLFDPLVADSPGYADLRTFLDTEARADLWDLTLELTVTDLGEDSMSNRSWSDDMPDGFGPILMRTLHFFEDRGYIRLEEMPGYFAAPGDDIDPAVRLVGQAMGRRMGLADGAMPAAFDTLLAMSEEELEKAVENVLKNDERLAARLREFREQFDGQVEAEPSDSLTVLADQAFAWDVDFLDSYGDVRRVRLFIPTEPYEMNGAWFPEGRAVANPDDTEAAGDREPFVEWIYPLADAGPRATGLPQIVYADWAQANEDFQRERFGGTVLERQDLAAQCHWREQLDDTLRAEWDAFVDAIRPAPDLTDTLRRFRFSGEAEPQPDGDPERVTSELAAEAIRNLMTGVKLLQKTD